MSYKTIDLCAGIGGIRKGFEMTGHFKNVLSAEIDKYACITYEHLYGENPKNDLTSETFKTTLAQTKYDILLAGFPCQAFSSAGKQLGFRDKTKGTIFFDIADIISRTSPKAIFLENVENLISHDNGNTLKTIIETLEDELNYRIIGVSLDEDGEFSYSSKSFLRNSKYFGLPQNRPRAYIMAFSKQTYGDAVRVLTDNLPLASNQVIFGDLNDILENDVDEIYYLSSGYWETLKSHKKRQIKNGNGYGYIIVNSSERKHPIANTILATGGSGKERNLVFQHKDGIANKTLPRKKSKLNSDGIRIMTPTEWGKLQGFIGYAFVDDDKDGFSFPESLSDNQKYKQLGNSVTIPVIKEMANFMIVCFNKMIQSQLSLILDIATYTDFFNKRDIIESLHISTNQADFLIKKLIEINQLEQISRGKNVKYKIV